LPWLVNKTRSQQTWSPHLSVRLAADYVKEHLPKLLTQKPEIIEGPVKAHD